MESSLLYNLTYPELKVAEALPLERCEIIARLANLRLQLNQSNCPGKLLIQTLDRRGFDVEQYRQYLKAALSTKIVKTFYKPSLKIAVLIANERYQHLSRLATPSIDCDSLGNHLKDLGFIVVTIKNTRSTDLKEILEDIFTLIAENSYCFIFYAGHGCEICNTKCTLGVDCPESDITEDHCVTENFILNAVAKCKPELCVLIMDMCRINLERASNPQIYESILSVPPATIHRNLLISYSTQSSSSAYEIVEIEATHTLDNNVTYEIQTGDTDRIIPNASQYVNALCTRLADEGDVSAMLDKVHADVEHAMKQQRPIKVQCGTDKRSLYDPPTGDAATILSKLREVGNNWRDHYNVF
ncbi:hypothetical protein O0L34_g1745 [Tuta absoluta]|nr:hypothetical protein O0L34_g1745 [Tuta absoluta]